MLGLHAPQRVNVATATVQTFEALDDAAMLARVEEQLASLGELRSKLMTKMRVVDMQLPALPVKGDDDEGR